MVTDLKFAWVTDDNGNQCSLEHFGSVEKAQEALKSLKNCKNCVDCENCSYCENCAYCRNCSYCVGCFKSVTCKRCLFCTICCGCEECSYAYGLTSTSFVVPSNVIDVPKIDHIHSLVHAAASNPKALTMKSWHTCKNTHCRAGWVVTLAGSEGERLEAMVGTGAAALMIYQESSPNLFVNVARFYDDNKTALADMKHMADLESASE